MRNVEFFEAPARPVPRTFGFCAALAAVFAALFTAGPVMAQYFPEAGGRWERRAPADVGVDTETLQDAIAFSRENETRFPEALTGIANVRDLELKIALDIADEPYSTPIGPIKPRGDVTGLVIKDGYVIAEWGQPDRVDMTFSISKTFLSTVAGLAWDRRMIRDTHDRAHQYVPGELFSTPHNRLVTWDHLLRQTSGWRGILWGKPDWADRPGDQPWSDLARTPDRPGTRWEYNDVRVNVFALALMHVWRKPLPEVLNEYVMRPIGASSTWQWHGYENSWVVIDGQEMQSVSGGGHWGGGMWISALDMARFGYLFLNNGEWDGKRILSEDWIQMALTPTSEKPDYGYMNFFLNDGETKSIPTAPDGSYSFRGSGSNVIYIDPLNDLVVVVRWIDRDALDGFIERIVRAVQ